MAHNHHSHHDSNSSSYAAHVMNFRNIDFCIGCLGSKFFLILILPLLIRVFIYPSVVVSPIVDWSVIFILWILSLSIYSYEFITGNIVNNYIAKILVSSYLFGSIFYVLLLQSELEIATSRLLMLLFALPQMAIYSYTMISKSEFNHSKTKLLVRLMFIISFFFSLINFSDNTFTSLIIIFSGVLIFARSRNFSDYRIGEDKHLVSAIDTNNDSTISKIFARLGIFASDGKIKNIEQDASVFTKSYFLILVGIFYFAGLILTTSSTPLLNNCNTDVVKSVAFSTPWIVAKTGNNKFCTNCGEASPKDFSFCENCGTQFQMQGQSGISSQDESYYPPQGDIHQSNRGYSQQSYQPYGAQRHRREDKSKSIPVFVGIAVFVIATLATGNIVLGVVLGVVGYFGTMLAISTDSMCLSYCIMNQLCNCICSSIDSDNRRRGNF